MCGIAGIYNYGRTTFVDRDELLDIRDHMTNRGPDAAGEWLSSDNRIGLAHRRLSIIDLSDAASQPMVDPECGNRIIFNGEIYNYQNLREELGDKGHRFRSHSDTEVLLKLYSEYGLDMLHKLRGMFAFSIWDENKKGLLLARDPFGIKPLYISDDGTTLRFASQVKALLAGGSIDTSLEPAGHVGFFLWGYVPEPYTLYRGIRALPAGSSLWIDRDGDKMQKSFFNIQEELTVSYYDSKLLPKIRHNQLREALLDSVRHHLIADVPVGVFLSAGLDSATLLALAKEIEESETSTVTLGFREFAGTKDDEVPHAEAVAQRYGSIHHTKWISKENFKDHRENLFEAMDQPSIDGVNSYFVSLAAKKAGLKAVLSGLGGDELFAGYSSFRDIPRLVTCMKPFSVVPYAGKVFRYITAPILKHFTSPKYSGILEYGRDYASAYLLRSGLFMPWELPEVLDGDLVKAGWQELQTLSTLRQSLIGLREPRIKMCALETTWYMRNQLLRDVDWASMAHSLEVRTPLVDIELFRTVNHMVHTDKAPGKRDMAACPAINLPDSVIARSKTGFTIPVRKWLSQSAKTNSKVKRGLRGWAELVYEQNRSPSYGGAR